MNPLSFPRGGDALPENAVDVPLSPRLIRVALACCGAYLAAVSTSPLWLPDLRAAATAGVAGCPSALDARVRCGIIANGATAMPAPPRTVPR